ncbi:hypothetical protein [Persicobacter psychrovividus]|uniref:Cation transporter n=1 Tax=Persicobacter psychrovividus TaxID=387638 RepID=A0ABN6LEJ6_9BACT|nr:hypothetical protein PEPS_38000 [Persicobacter psychrovividus]
METLCRHRINISELKQTLSTHPRINQVEVLSRGEMLEVVYHFQGEFIDWDMYSEVRQLVQAAVGSANLNAIDSIKGLPSARYNLHLMENLMGEEL